MLDFWIRTCGPCLASFPHLNELQQKFGNNSFELLSINTEDKKENIAFFYNKFKPRYKMLFGAETLAEEYGIPAYPAIIILDKSGKIIYTAMGFDQQAIEKVIKANL
jgi:thiol-disulfide isomerase/thioredoxin